MRKLLLTILLAIPSFVFAEKADSTKVFSCSEFKQDLKVWNDLSEEEIYSVKSWAVKAAKIFKLNSDGAIECTYIIRSNRDRAISDLRDLCMKWFDISFVRAQNVIEDKGVDYIKAHGVYANIVTYTGFYSATCISSPVDINIFIKENRIKIQLIVQHYSMGSAAAFSSAESRLDNVSNCYPFNSKGDHKESYSYAFINTYSKNLNEVQSFMDFLNAHTKESISAPSEDW